MVTGVEIWSFSWEFISLFNSPESGIFICISKFKIILAGCYILKLIRRHPFPFRAPVEPFAAGEAIAGRFHCWLPWPDFPRIPFHRTCGETSTWSEV